MNLRTVNDVDFKNNITLRYKSESPKVKVNDVVVFWRKNDKWVYTVK